MGGKWIHRLSHIDLERMTAVCAECGTVALYMRPSNGRLICMTVKRCGSDTRHAPGTRTSSRPKAIRGTCPLCGDEDVLLVRDHCHATGKQRESICGLCNSMLGFARDNPDVLRAGADYLERHVWKPRRSRRAL